MAFTDNEIINSVRKGEDEKALGYLYKVLLPKIKRLVQSNGGTIDDANDIFQDAILVFYRQVKLNKFNEQYEIAGFVYGVSRNLWINHVKRQNKNLPLNTIAFESSEIAPDVIEDLISAEREAVVHQVLGQLGEKCKELLLYTVYHRLTMKEICQKMGFSTENAAKTRHYKCKQKLIELVGSNMLFKEILR